MKNNEVIDFVCKQLNLDKNVLLSQKRWKAGDYAHCGFIIAKILIDRGLIQKRVAQMLNKKTQPSALHAEWRCRVLIKTNEAFREKYNSVIKAISQ